jgi:hypothetical protein
MQNQLLIEFLKSAPGVDVDEESDIITFRFRANFEGPFWFEVFL